MLDICDLIVQSFILAACFLWVVFCTRGDEEVAKLNPPHCGLPTRPYYGPKIEPLDNEVDHGRISQGKDAEDGQFPYFVHLWNLNRTDKPLTLCGATIVTPRVLLTVAHCLENRENDFLSGQVVGYIGSARTPQHGTKVFAEAVVMHPKFRYVKNNPKDDVGLIFLNDTIRGMEVGWCDQNPTTPLEYQPNQVCVPEDGHEVGQEASFTVVGFGRTNDEPVEHASHLQWAVVHTPDKKARSRGIDCKSGYRECDPEREILTHDNNNTKTTTCKGDSGGPLLTMAHHPDGGVPRATLVGVSSWGIGDCNFPGDKGFYMKTSFYNRWIRTAIKRYFDSENV